MVLVDSRLRIFSPLAIATVIDHKVAKGNVAGDKVVLVLFFQFPMASRVLAEQRYYPCRKDGGLV